MFERFMEIMEITPDIQEKENADVFDNVQWEICFRDVSFKYNDKNDYVFRHLHLNVHQNEYISLVGTSGVRKTTLCSLLPRFYDPTDGIITIDYKNIKHMTLSSLRKHIGIVRQDVYLFSGTIMENILYGKMNASDEMVIEAAKKANAHDIIMQLPQGYETDCGQRGVKLSGGRKAKTFDCYSLFKKSTNSHF